MRTVDERHNFDEKLTALQSLELAKFKYYSGNRLDRDSLLAFSNYVNQIIAIRRADFILEGIEPRPEQTKGKKGAI